MHYSMMSTNFTFFSIVNNQFSNRDIGLFNFKMSFTSDRPTTNIVQAQQEQGNWVNNPWVSNKEFDYKIQVDYAF